jgi:hypothetical protein
MTYFYRSAEEQGIYELVMGEHGGEWRRVKDSDRLRRVIYDGTKSLKVGGKSVKLSGLQKTHEIVKNWISADVLISTDGDYYMVWEYPEDRDGRGRPDSSRYIERIEEVEHYHPAYLEAEAV